MSDCRAICVYCSSSDALDGPYFEAARQLGEAIAAQGCDLVYGGGRLGLMGALARTVQAEGGRVIGVLPEQLMPQAYHEADELIITRDLRERKAIMEERAGAFIGMPGGFGTLEEVLEILTLKQLGFHTKPVVLMNILGFYDHLVAFFEHLYREQFAKADYRGLYHVADEAGHIMEYLTEYLPPDLPRKWFDSGDINTAGE